MPQPRFSYSRLLGWLRPLVRNDHLVLVILAALVGCLGGGAVIAFRETIHLVQASLFGSGDERLFASAVSLAWWQVLLAPAVGGLVVGALVHVALPGRRPQGVADVIEAGALKGGRMSSRVGLLTALASAVSIGAGASVGREGPAVHLSASLCGWIGRRLGLSQPLTRTLLGCGAAAAVAASFNAPIAGALFANEVVIGHYALRAFAPIVIASVAGTAVSRAWFGDFPAFAIDQHFPASLLEFPAFFGLGIAAAGAAIVFMHSIVIAGRVAERTPIPAWLRPAAAGLMVGAIALAFPQVLGVGYGVSEQALLATLPLWLLVGVGTAKILATAISLGWGFAGGVFSPSLVIGAMVGGAYGIVATAVFPQFSGASAYTIVGMGAVAAAVLGAPISTTLIVFEMTGDYALTLGVMVAVVTASTISQQFYGKSFFIVQLKRRNIDLRSGFEAEVLKTVRVGEILSKNCERVPLDATAVVLRRELQKSKSGELFVVRPTGELYGTLTLADLSEAAFDPALDILVRAGDVARTQLPTLNEDDDLETALVLIGESGEQRIAVVDNAESMMLKGCVSQGELMAAYNRAILKRRHEEHGH